jgi:sulfate adenylyltransferase large subunit
MTILRLATAGSVDDGKSTLIGRLLYDSKSLFDDQYEAVRAASERRGEDFVNLALLTDGLRAEREQGITIDVAYRYFATPRRTFILADTPGHVQYTRNMVTGASTADLALILVDARTGVVEQTRRHAFLATLLGLSHAVVCVNKMDLVGWSQERFDAIRADLESLAAKMPSITWHFLPVSALNGDNIVDRSDAAPWYDGPALLDLLETVTIPAREDLGARFPVQYVIRPQREAYHDFRGYAGRLAAGRLRPGDPITVLPSGATSRIAAIETADGPRSEARFGDSVVVTLTDDLDISRGDLLVAAGDPPALSQELVIDLCWLGDRPLQPGGRYALRLGTRDARCVVKDVLWKLDIANLEPQSTDLSVATNDIARVRLRTTVPLAADSYRRSRATGSLILIDEGTNVTVGAGMVADP